MTDNFQHNGFASFLGLATCALLLLGLVAVAPAPAQASTNTEAYIGMPFTGYFDKWGFATPGSHGIYNGGDWSVDLYASPGTAVNFDVYDPVNPYQLYAWGEIAYIATDYTCSDGENMGDVVWVDIINRFGATVGRVAYVHLDSVSSLSVGDVINRGDLLGYTYQWNQSDCYVVDGADDVHVHFEAVSYTSGYESCWEAASTGYYGAGTDIAKVGNTGTSSASSCP